MYRRAQVEVEKRKKGISWDPFCRWKQRRSRGSNSNVLHTWQNSSCFSYKSTFNIIFNIRSICKPQMHPWLTCEPNVGFHSFQIFLRTFCVVKQKTAFGSSLPATVATKIFFFFFLPNPNIFLNPTKCFLCPKLKQIIDRKGKFNFDKSEVVSAFCRNVIMTFILEIVLSNVNN